MSVAVTEALNRECNAQAAQAVRGRPRVLHLITSFEIGGTERQAVELLKRLDAKRYDVRLAVLRNEGQFYDEIRSRFSNVPEFPLTSFYNANALRQLARLRRLMVRQKIDLLHAHDFYSGLLGAAAARLAGVRVIACQRHLRLSDRRAHDFGSRVIHCLAHRLLVNSEAIRDKIIDQDGASPSKIRIIKNGIIESNEPRAEARQQLCNELRIGNGGTLIGTVARLQPVKGHRALIQAAATVLRERPEVHFVLVGDGPLRNEIQMQCGRLGIANRVHLMGDRGDVARLLPAFDLLVLASLHEGLPNAVMEAMAARVLVVATAVGGTKELIEDGVTGYLVAPEDPKALAERIRFALGDNEHRAEIVSAAHHRVTEAFGIERMVESVEALYDELMEGK
jgi:glycosyltransferase involved in cell wall biosynthesis